MMLIPAVIIVPVTPYLPDILFFPEPRSSENYVITEIDHSNGFGEGMTVSWWIKPGGIGGSGRHFISLATTQSDNDFLLALQEDDLLWGWIPNTITPTEGILSPENQ